MGQDRGSVREWIKTREWNEALALEVYGLAALYILGPAFVKSLSDRAAVLARTIEAYAPVAPDGSTSVMRPRGWIAGRRG